MVFGMEKFILTLSCQDDFGIVAAVTSFLSKQGAFITELAQYGDPSTQQFFLRAEFDSKPSTSPKALSQAFEGVSTQFGMKFTFRKKGDHPKVLILVSKQSHCLNDLLHRVSTGELPIDIAAIASNHTDLEQMATWHHIPFYHLPITPETKQEQEGKILQIIEEQGIEITILARYMQILSPNLCEELKGKVINIHHSFLPSFKGARPYHQAYNRGVKIIGATAHYVTDDLDEGPIIAQEVTPVTHAHLPKDLIQMGCDNESKTLARAVKLHVEMRVLLDGCKTVIFQ